MKTALLLILSLAASPAPKDDLYVMLNGDRVSGQTVTKGKTSITVQTAYGKVTIPRGRILKVVWGDGHEEVMNSPLPTPPPPPPPEPSLHMALLVSGQAFWQAWPQSAKGKEIDPTLKFEVRLDDEVVATYSDSHLDPGDLPGALVNSFSFEPGHVSVTTAEGVVADAPETKVGKSLLRINLPSARAGSKHLVLAYASNIGTASDPHWQDLASGDMLVELEKGATLELAVQQERGRMEYSRFLGVLSKKMRNVETFRVGVRAARGVVPEPAPSATTPPSP
jgi:hypothetical protein